MNASSPTGQTGTFRALIFCGVFEPGVRGGGPVISLAQIVDTVDDTTSVTMVTADRDLGCRRPYPDLSGRWVTRGTARIFYLNARRWRNWVTVLKSARESRHHLLYLNSFWSPVWTVAPLLMKAVGLIQADRILLAPRGELSVGAMAISVKKKSIFMRVWRPMLIRMQVEFHASTSHEASDIATIFPSSSIIVASDQIRPPFGALGNKPTSNVLRLVYLGRIALMKSVDVALQAVNLCGLPVSFDIYGPIEDPEHWSMCQQIIRGAPANTHITYHGELAHDRVAEVLAQFDALILPTKGENFGHVIAESLAAGCPVICSDRTPWTTVLVSGAGEVVQGFNAEDWAEVLQAWASMTPSDRWQRKLRTREAYEAWRAAQNGLNVIDAVATRHRAVGNA